MNSTIGTIRNDKIIRRKFYQYLLPSVLMFITMMLGDICDSIFVGNFLGEDALSAVSLTTPIILIIQIPLMIFAVGGSILAANYLGKREIEKANKIFSSSIIFVCIFVIIIAAIGPFIYKPIAHLFAGDNAKMEQYMAEYSFVYFEGNIAICLSYILATFYAVDNNPRLTTASYLVAVPIKLITQFCLLRFSSIGISGASLASIIGYFSSLFVVIFYIKSKSRMLHFSFKIKGIWPEIKESIKAGFSLGLFNLFTAVNGIVINCSIIYMLSAQDMAIYSALSSSLILVDIFVGGIIQIIPQICSILLGDKDYYSIHYIIRKVLLYLTITTLVIMAVIMIYPNLVCLLFGITSVEQSKMELVIRIYAICFLFYELNNFTKNYFPTIFVSIISNVTIALRLLILALPLCILGIHLWGILGVAIGAVAAESLTVLITYLFNLIYRKKKKLPDNYFLIPNEKTPLTTLDITIQADEHEAGEISEQLIDYCKEKQVGERDAYIIGLAGEEIVDNIYHYAYKKKFNYIDINLNIQDDSIMLRIRDDGVPFDPLSITDEEEQFSTKGLVLIKKLASEFNYIRVINTNNTIITIKRN